MHTKKIELKSNQYAQELCGQYDQNLKLIEEVFNVEIIPKGTQLIIRGNQKLIKVVESLVKELLNRIVSNGILRSNELENRINFYLSEMKHPHSIKKNIINEAVFVSEKGKIVKPKSKQQYKYVKAIENSDIVFAIGPAGTGKTYLACASALNALKNEKVSRIILTRPVVEAGEKLGFLPGDFYEKVEPYLHPLYDAFYSMIGPEKFQRYRREQLVEIVPLAYMRGRTLNNAFVILDEAQNSTLEQMKMFLTRLGFDSQAVITGDITQVDLEDKKYSGLIQVQHILKGIKGIKFIYFSQTDVVRHILVKKIISAYQRYENNK